MTPSERTLGAKQVGLLRRLIQQRRHQTREQLEQRQLHHHTGLARALDDELERWGQQLEAVLKGLPLPTKARTEIGLLETARNQSVEQFLEELDGTRLVLLGHSPMAEELPRFAEELRSLPLHQREAAKAAMLDQWQSSVEQRYLADQLALLDKQREQLLEDLYQRLEGAQALGELIPVQATGEAGRLWDMADVALSNRQRRDLNQLANWLSRQAQIQTLAEQLGKMAHASASGRVRRVKEASPKREVRPSPLPEEVVGVQQGKDLGRLLAVAMSLLSSEELELLFYKQLIDAQLLVYQMRGKQPVAGRVKNVFRARPSEALEKGGPFILCIDTSASMSGYPERCAKALALALARVAVQDGRDCRILIFSTSVITFDLTGSHGLSQLRDFLGYQFHGGTDPGPCIDEACESLDQELFANADVLMVSDFIAPRFQPERLAKVDAARNRGTRFHAVPLSRHGNPALLAQFDQQWPLETGMAQRFGR
ncbi:VWA domain-containing protein [Ferrimonas gelatinilytica]|uniref:ATPase RavA stimulator ViaA n=1 Tax=Ferrimonas gelatinilytica TaxID=1255257 RepID=A0ABP9S7V9_9GAMM